MKKFFLYFIFFFHINTVYAEVNLAYLDVQYIIDNSNLGQIYKKNLKEKSDKIISDI